jgi:hypothetical protein
VSVDVGAFVVYVERDASFLEPVSERAAGGALNVSKRRMDRVIQYLPAPMTMTFRLVSMLPIMASCGSLCEW